MRAAPDNPYILQATIAAVHAQAPGAARTDWRQLAAFYNRLAAPHHSPIVELNRAVAIAMATGCEVGLRLIEGLRTELRDYHLLWAVRADLLRRLDRWDEVAQCYREALNKVSNEVEGRFLRRRLAEM